MGKRRPPATRAGPGPELLSSRRDRAGSFCYDSLTMSRALCLGSFLTFALLFPMAPAQARALPESPRFDEAAAERFARLALACVHQEYPNKIAHVLNGDADVKPPRE